MVKIDALKMFFSIFGNVVFNKSIITLRMNSLVLNF